MPKDENEKEMLKGAGVVFLENESEAALANTFFKLIQSGEHNLVLNYDLARQYAKDLGFDIKEAWEIWQAMLSALNKALLEKITKKPLNKG